jgi:anthranilate phosphoribosyltransferase
VDVPAEPSGEFQPVFTKLASGHDLTREESRDIFERIMRGEVSHALLADLLRALAVKGESVDELVGAAEAMRATSIKVRCDAECIDTCGTGGDGISTFNVSTTAAIIAAAAGATVAKHGNRSATRASGSTEVLGYLGIDVEADVTTVERCLREVRIGYLNARELHPAMKHAAPVRRTLPIRTIFNLLGPLTNPAGAKRQLLGVPRPDLVDKMAGALIELGAKHAWVVHGRDGLCDLTITGPAIVAEVRESTIRRFELSPELFGLPRAPLESLRVASPAESATAVIGVLRGLPGPKLHHALLNAAAAIVVAGLAQDLAEGLERASHAINSGASVELLARWRALAPA